MGQLEKLQVNIKTVVLIVLFVASMSLGTAYFKFTVAENTIRVTNLELALGETTLQLNDKIIALEAKLEMLRKGHVKFKNSSNKKFKLIKGVVKYWYEEINRVYNSGKGN